jgi:hypothetical protein
MISAQSPQQPRAPGIDILYCIPVLRGEQGIFFDEFFKYRVQTQSCRADGRKLKAPPRMIPDRALSIGNGFNNPDKTKGGLAIHRSGRAAGPRNPVSAPETVALR